MVFKHWCLLSRIRVLTVEVKMPGITVKTLGFPGLKAGGKLKTLTHVACENCRKWSWETWTSGAERSMRCDMELFSFSLLSVKMKCKQLSPYVLINTMQNENLPCDLKSFLIFASGSFAKQITKKYSSNKNPLLNAKKPSAFFYVVFSGPYILFLSGKNTPSHCTMSRLVGEDRIG